MDEISNERHPLDDDTADAPRSPVTHAGRDIAQAYRPLLKASIYVVVASGAVVFLSGVAASNALPNSFLEVAADAVSRMSMVILLCGFVAVLFAYRLPHLQTWFGSVRLTGTTGGTVVGASRIERRWTAELELLYAINLAIAGILWASVLLAPVLSNQIIGLILASLIVILTSLLITMIVWHTGYLRAYAIGATTAAFMVTIFGSGMGLFGYFGYMGRGLNGGGVALGVLFSLILIAGLVCATYVFVLTKIQNDSNAL